MDKGNEAVRDQGRRQDTQQHRFHTGDGSSSHETSKVVFLTVNDVYELLPDVNGVGGLAQLATMIQAMKQRLAHDDTYVIVTLNGDFLWRSERDRKDKGAMMVKVLNQLGIEYVVVGNHEFDFGAEHLRDVLSKARFTCFGSNVRSTIDPGDKLYPGLVDTCVIPVGKDLRLGLFGVVTTVTGNDPFAGPHVVFQDERSHARQCVEELKSQGVTAVVALTHLKVQQDVRLAMHVPGIDLILGGHDHFPVTCTAGVKTLIHKSGMDALWLGVVEMTLTRSMTYQGENVVHVGFQWQMLLNKGYNPDPACLAILNKYLHDVEQEEAGQGKLEPLGIALTALDGRRVTCRTRESNLGNLVTDALRKELHADIGLVNAGYIKGNRLNDHGLVITRKWLETFLPLAHPTVVVQVTMRELKHALVYWLRRYPAMSSSHPQFSGLRVVYDKTKTTIVSIRLSNENYDNDTSNSRDTGKEEQDETELDRLVTVAMPLHEKLDGWQCFASASHLRSGPVVRDLVEKFVQQRPQIAYPPQEDRLRIVEPSQAQGRQEIGS